MTVVIQLALFFFKVFNSREESSKWIFLVQKSISSNENGAIDFFNYLNLQHPNIKFTLEKEINNCLSFLNIKINKLTDKCVTSV